MEENDLKMGRGALLEEEGFRQSLCSVILHSVKWITMQWTQGAISQPDQMEWCPGPACSPSTAAGCSQTWGETGTFTLVLPLKPPSAFWVWPNTNNLKWFSPQWFPPPCWKHFEEGALGSLGIRDNLPVIVTGVRSSLKWTWWCYHVQLQKTLLYHISGCPQREKGSLFSSPMRSPSSLWALPVNEKKQDTDTYLKIVC